MPWNEPITVLIAEDDYLISEEIKRVMTKTSRYTVVGEAFDGKEALAMTMTLNPDVVLMDIEMPEMNGLESARQIQKHRPTPIVVLTAHESQQFVDQACLQTGIGAYLTKPPNFSEIDRAIAIAIARHQDMVALRATNEALERKVKEVHALHGILPICCFCKRIRNDNNEWEQIETYIHHRSAASFSHSFCPECAKINYPEECRQIFPKDDD
ncbi:MAG: response regulator transcription factor [Proteobacteria bacterium]|nr:response regulator [Desulfobulbaceae bacterium]MBU4151444.1 response regulator transcription factor [Pseudomonadota bacterium]